MSKSELSHVVGLSQLIALVKMARVIDVTYLSSREETMDLVNFRQSIANALQVTSQFELASGVANDVAIVEKREHRLLNPTLKGTRSCLPPYGALIRFDESGVSELVSQETMKECLSIPGFYEHTEEPLVNKSADVSETDITQKDDSGATVANTGNENAELPPSSASGVPVSSDASNAEINGSGNPATSARGSVGRRSTKSTQPETVSDGNANATPASATDSAGSAAGVPTTATTAATEVVAETGATAPPVNQAPSTPAPPSLIDSDALKTAQNLLHSLSFTNQGNPQ